MCEHPVAGLVYLTTSYTPHVVLTEGMSVAVHMFLCQGCGKATTVFQEIPRGYMADGTIGEDLQKEITRRRADREVESRVAQKLAEVQIKGEKDGNDRHASN